MMLSFEVKCTSSTQSHEGHYTTTFVGKDDPPVDSLRREVKIVHPEMPFKIGEVYSVSIDAKSLA